jgi:hypothetical protein
MVVFFLFQEGKAEADLAIVKNKNALRINTNRKLKK